MSPRALVALARRHLIAVGLVFLVAAGTAYAFKRTPPTYQENGTLVLAVPESKANPNPYAESSGTLITTGEIVVKWLTGPLGEQQIRQEGATGGFAVGLVNLSNEQFPLYAEPYVVMSGTGTDPAQAHSTFQAGFKVFNDKLRSLQAQQGVVAGARIATKLIGDPGPLILPPSRKRSLAGLFLLTLVAAYCLARFLDLHPVRIGRLVSQARRVPAGRRAGEAPARLGGS